MWTIRDLRKNLLNGLTMFTKQEKPSQREVMEQRLASMETQAVSTEERAEFAEKEKELRDRIRAAQERIEATRPQSAFGNFSLSSFIPQKKGAKVVIVLIAIVLLLVIMAKAC